MSWCQASYHFKIPHGESESFKRGRCVFCCFFTVEYFCFVTLVKMTLREKSRENNNERYAAKVLVPTASKNSHFFVLPLQDGEMNVAICNAIYELVPKDKTRLVKIKLSHRLDDDQNRADTGWIDPRETDLKMWNEILANLQDDLGRQNSLQTGPAWLYPASRVSFDLPR